MLVRLAALAGAAVLLTTLAIGEHDDGAALARAYGGPLENRDWRHGSALVMGLRPPHPGGQAAAGMAVVTNRGTEPAVIENVALAEPSRNLRVAAIYTADYRRDFWAADQNSWPPPGGDYERGSVRPARGRVVPPATAGEAGELGLQILVVIDLPRAGRYTFRGVRIDYRVNGDRYWIVVPTSYAICTPRKLKCPTVEPYTGPYHGG